MKKWLKFIVYPLIGIVSCLLLLLLGLSLFFDPNDYKPKIESLVEENIGRKLSINGDIHWTVFPWLGISTGELQLSNLPGFSNRPFAQIGSATVQVKLVPLFSKEIEVDRVVIQDLLLNLEKNKQGITNWVDFSEASKNQKQESNNALAVFAIGGVSIKNAGLNWDDHQSGKSYALSEVNLETDQIQLDVPISSSLSLVLHDKTAASQYRLDMATVWSIDKNQELLQLNGLKLDVNASGPAIPGNEQTLVLKSDKNTINLKQYSASIPKLLLTSGALDLVVELQGKDLNNSPNITGHLLFNEMNLQSVLQQYAIELPEFSDSKALTKFQLQANFKAGSESFAANDILINLDDTQVNGFVSINNFAKPKTRFSVTADTLDLDRYLPPKKSASANGSQTETVGTPTTAVAAGLDVFPVETLRQLNVNGELNIGHLRINNLRLKDFSMQLNSREGQLSSQNKIGSLYHGKYQGKLNLDVAGQQPIVSINDQLLNVQLEPLLTDLHGKAKMTGLINAHVRLKGSGNTTQALKSSSQGSMEFTFTEGVIKGFNVPQLIEQGKALFSKNKTIKQSDKQETHYSQITATAQVNRGIVKNDDLLIKASDLRITGSGTANLVTDRLDYKVTGKMLKQAATASEPEKISGSPVVIDVSGTISQPVYTINLKESIPEEKKQKIIKKVEDKLGKDAGKILNELFK